VPPSERSQVVETLLRAAEERLWTDFRQATTSRHPVRRGAAREVGVADLLRVRLPATFRILTNAEAVDHQDRHSGELDVVVMDGARNPILSVESTLLPAEALLCVVEVKSLLNAQAMRDAVDVARSIRALRPFGMPLVGSRQGGSQAPGADFRCHVSLLAYASTLVPQRWIPREWARYNSALRADDPVDLIDMIVVLDRGTILPPFGKARTGSADQSVLHHWFVSIANFMQRENDRRPAFDWQVYLNRYGRGWNSLR
jgi:hypothetical protein